MQPTSFSIVFYKGFLLNFSLSPRRRDQGTAPTVDGFLIILYDFLGHAVSEDTEMRNLDGDFISMFGLGWHNYIINLCLNLETC